MPTTLYVDTYIYIVVLHCLLNVLNTQKWIDPMTCYTNKSKCISLSLFTTKRTLQCVVLFYITVLNSTNTHTSNIYICICIHVISDYPKKLACHQMVGASKSVVWMHPAVTHGPHPPVLITGFELNSSQSPFHLQTNTQTHKHTNTL